ncbi:hypothetical protein X994_6626 (plasmid) [Burkholderia pseudomallei]|uniref:Uncharacterized protein n=1 Tax=Xanthomonas axonopodis pv. melhusii TaxID=487834 RepID=A0A1T1NZ76_9XANT|nr:MULTISPECIES: hypothetical protein [Pseudomonadota]AIV73621.1 hypothetical protein X994_6626 [Burkholderia pseudomallei]OOW68670.1 hypothetical protein Xmlh_13080 [Xanthomonas axonopodis pv. melhusii]
MATKTKKAHTAELVKLSAELPALIDALEVEIETVTQRMAALKKAGLIYASEHWRKDAEGNPKYFYLLYPQQPGEPRKREYVGCDADRIEEARAGIARAKEYDECGAVLAGLNSRVHHVIQAMQDARRYLTGKRW